ncbi:MAG: hypothetical protein AB1345_05060 [Chloroflexota bacterium]
MKMFVILAIIISSVLLFGCRSSESAIQTAIAQTSTAQPTLTFTPIPTNTPTDTPTITPSPTFTNTPTETPTSTETSTNTPTPTQASALNTSYEDMRLKMESWTNAKFEYVYDIGELRSYEGKDYTAGLAIYLLEFNGEAAGFMIQLSESPLFDTEKQVLILATILEYYISPSVLDWLTDNWPQEEGEKITTIFNTSTGEIAVSFGKDDETHYILVAIDMQFAP